ncbi:MAG: hypothetical protein QME16_00195 [Planctomycetota bacterium]|nr:hypothetical protein [Planctomycetota bacterium]
MRNYLKKMKKIKIPLEKWHHLLYAFKCHERKCDWNKNNDEMKNCKELREAFEDIVGNEIEYFT